MIYFLRAGTEGHVKIGWTRDETTLTERIQTLQTGQPYPLSVMRRLDDAPRWAEAWLHGYFAGARAVGEWFEFQPDMLDIEPPDERGASTTSVPFTLRVPLDVMAALHLRAKAEERSIAQVMVRLLRKSLAPSGSPERVQDTSLLEVDHIDGEPTNTDPASMRLVERPRPGKPLARQQVQPFFRKGVA